MKGKINIIAISEKTGERREFDSAYQMAKTVGVSTAAVFQALSREGLVKEWRVYLTPDAYRAKIEAYKEIIKKLES